MALAAAADGHAAVETALTAATLQSASSVWLAQFPSEVSCLLAKACVHAPDNSLNLARLCLSAPTP